MCQKLIISKVSRPLRRPLLSTYSHFYKISASKAYTKMIVLNFLHFYSYMLLAPFPDSTNQAKECKRILETRKAKESDSPMKAPEGIHPCQLLDFR